MARAHKCDRCGNFYTKNSRFLFDCEYKDGIRFVAGAFQSNRIDLCDDCLSDLIEFLDGADIVKKEDQEMSQ